jgi:hypothetical protein
MKSSMLPYEYSKEMEHEKWREQIPFINFPSDWTIQICPPFSGAVVRFRVKKDKAHVSIYLDCYDNLGCAVFCSAAVRCVRAGTWVALRGSISLVRAKYGIQRAQCLFSFWPF